MRVLAPLVLIVILAAACAGGGSVTLASQGRSVPQRPPDKAKLEPPAGRIVHGMGQWEEYNQRFLPALPVEIRPAAQLLFLSIGDTPRGWRPQGVAARLQALNRDGFVPVLDIGLRGNQPPKAELDKMADPLYGIDNEVASSTRFDSRIQDLARAIREFGRPVIVRIGGEFNGWWNGYHPYDYPKAFRKIVEMFRKAGVTNAAFCWCYEPAGPGDFDEKNAAGDSKWYPGDDIVDWFSIDWFNKEDFTGPHMGGRQGRELTAHGRTRKFLDMAVAQGKPVIIAESSPSRYDLSDPAQADAAWREWFEPYFQIISERTEIKWFHLISYDWSRASYFAATGWKNNDFTASPALLKRLIEELRKPRYLHTAEKEKLNGYAAMTLPSAPQAGQRPSRPTAAPPPRANRAARPEGPQAAVPAAARAELAKWDNPAAYLPPSGPGGTEWDAAYRSFIQTDESAAAKGFPTRAEAAAQIKADAAQSPENLRKHKGWVLFIKHYSQAYRPEEATADLRILYEELVAMGAGADAGKAALPFQGDPRLTIHRDVVYGRNHPQLQKLDAYLVKSPRPTPVVIEIHGGGWRRGRKSQFTYRGGLIESVLGAGISVISIDYRLTPGHPFPAQMEDVARAVQFVRSMAKGWNLDPGRIAALGGSAGAHLSAWISLHDDLARAGSPDPVERFSTRLAGFVAFAGPMDLTRVRPTELARQPLRGEDFAKAFTAAFACTPEQFERDEAIRGKIRDASPIFLVTPDDPPALVMGAAGQEMRAGRHPPAPEVINDPHSAWQVVLLADALDKAGVQVLCCIGPDVGKNPEADNAAVLSFLRGRLLPKEVAP